MPEDHKKQVYNLWVELYLLGIMQSTGMPRCSCAATVPITDCLRLDVSQWGRQHIKRAAREGACSPPLIRLYIIEWG